jgi:uncharacterized protein
MESFMNEPWFKNGLRFKCTGCGKCCTGSDGYVFLSPEDLISLSRHFNLSVQELIDRYTRIVDGQICLLDAPDSDECIFLKDNRCTAYESRPIQCQAFPWWLHNLKSPESWRSAAEHCEGIDHPGAPIIAGPKIAQECMRYVDNLVEQNCAFDYNRSKK